MTNYFGIYKNYSKMIYYATYSLRIRRMVNVPFFWTFFNFQKLVYIIH